MLPCEIIKEQVTQSLQVKLSWMYSVRSLAHSLASNAALGCGGHRLCNRRSLPADSTISAVESLTVVDFPSSLSYGIESRFQNALDSLDVYVG
jgi:hypothetical protein